MTGNILIQSLKDITDQEISINKFIGTQNKEDFYKKAAHRRDDHYLFIFQKKGRSTVMIDFKEVALIESAVLCVLPGQIHYGVTANNDTEAWLITLDTNFVEEDYRRIFDDYYFQNAPITISTLESTPLDDSIELLASIVRNRHPLDFMPQVIHSLISACVGMFASAYRRQENREVPLSRTHLLTQQFKRLLLQQFKTHKTTSAYATSLNITPAYLNDAVKQTTGLTVSFWIQQTIIMEAKRLLYATNASVKEIASQLGFTDHAYFTRYFSHAEGQSPSRFRRNSRK
ncbi:AraC family transcriptional activator of pobA [Chitinophaga sp. W2I13]|uniref:helix-turn-helix domain-containing protein n=1 Tax=Chitinophaga sp. W2I13 TaxID=3373923 RepID=UPI003D20F232